MHSKRLLPVLALLALLPGCGRAARPNVLVITMDTTRADRLGAYGYAAARTPSIDRLAAEGVLCSDAVAAAPITMPSHSSIFTGLYPPAHGVRDNGTYVLPADANTLAERLRARGYATHATVSALVLNRRYGLDQGFDEYDDDLWGEDEPKMFMIRDRPARKTADRAIAWIDGWLGRPEKKPFFMWVHFFDPHQPMQPEPEDAVLAATPYDAEIAGMDRAIGRIVDRLRDAKVLDDTIVVLTSDHGESLGEHGEKTHAVFIYDATVRVPLVVRYPKQLPARRYDGPVRHIDIVPTVLKLAGIDGGDTTQGRDLVEALAGKVDPPALAQYSESLLSEVGFGMAPLYGVREGGFKWIRAPRPELYDLKKDPVELENLHAADRRTSFRLDARLGEILKNSEARALKVEANPLDKETEETLMALGYLSRKSDRDAMSGMDPKDGMPIYTKVEDARHLAQREKWPEAEALLREVVEALPRNVSALNVLGLVNLRQGRLDAARDWYLRSLGVDPAQARVYTVLGSIAMLEQDLDEADKMFKQALAASPGFVEAMMNLGFSAELRGEDAKAEELYKQARALDPTFPRVPRRLGDLFYEREEWGKALEQYESVIAISPGDYRAAIQAGNAARRAGDSKLAEEYLKKAEALRPDAWIPPYNLACLYALNGRSDDALSALERSVARGLSGAALPERDPDLASIRGSESFRLIVARIPRRPDPGV